MFQLACPPGEHCTPFLPPRYVSQASVDERLKGRMAAVFKRVFALGGRGDLRREEVLNLVGEARMLVNLGKL